MLQKTSYLSFLKQQRVNNLFMVRVNRVYLFGCFNIVHNSNVVRNSGFPTDIYVIICHAYFCFSRFTYVVINNLYVFMELKYDVYVYTLKHFKHT